MTAWSLSTLDPIPRLGWVDAPTPVEALPEAADELGFSWFGVKRDDRIEALRGGNKVRKLDYLLALEPFASAQRWASLGAVGSGHLAATTLAAAELGRTLEAHVFWEPASPSVTENLACIASGPTEIHFRHNRFGLVLRSWRVFRGRRDGPTPCIPAGGTVPEGVVGIVRGALELAAQIDAGELPAPDVIVVPWGTGGTAVGIALGLALAGKPTEVRAVATLEGWAVPTSVLGHHMQAALAYFERQGLALPKDFTPSTVVPVRGFVGPGYGHTTPDGLEAVQWLRGHGAGAEPIYGGKALSALRAHAGELAGKRVLYWLTNHGGNLPTDPSWRERLPKPLQARLDGGRGPTRRRVLLGAGAAALLVTGWRHTVGYGDFAGWQGLVLSRKEALVVAAAAEAVIPDRPGPLPTDGPTGREVAEAVDRYLVGMPKPMQLEIHGMFELLEQGTALDLQLARLTKADPARRLRFLLRLESFGGLIAQASRGIRDLCLLGWYQDPRTWPELGYNGPLVPEGGMGGTSRYAPLVAAPGQDPKGALR